MFGFSIKRVYPTGAYSMKLRQIVIPLEFKKTNPRPDKLINKYKHYIYRKSLMETIVVDRNGVLMDGYTSYLIAKMFDINEVQVEVR
ncbi:MAG: hypothetical protein RSF40_01765 [Oscillospiraceae bacterium]